MGHLAEPGGWQECAVGPLHPATPETACASQDRAVEQLERLFGQVLAALRSDPASPPGDAACDLSAVTDELAGVVQAGAREVAARLRQELPCWTAALEHVERLSRCRYLVPSGGLAFVHGELARVRQAAERLAGALEAVGTPGPADPEERPRLYPPLPDLQGADSRPVSEETLPEAPALHDTLVEAPLPRAEPEPPAEEAEPEPTAAGRSDAPAPALTFRQAQAIYGLAEDSRRGKDHARAIELYDEALRRAPTLRPARVRRGQLLLYLGQAQAAVDDFSAALLADDRDAETLQFRGDAHAVLGRLDVAVADYTRCLKLDPGRGRARFNRAVAYRLLGRLREALREFDDLLAADPEQTPALYNRGLVWAALGDYERAIDDLCKTVQACPEHPEARARLREIRQALHALRQPPPKQEPTARPEPPKAPVPEQPAVLRINCPNCGTEGAIRWEKMGRLHTCRRCARCYRVDPRGGMVEVARGADGRWVDRDTHERTSRQARARRVARLLVPLLLLAGVFLYVRPTPRPPGPAEQPLPAELQERAELFTRAWVGRDWPLMRRLVTPGEERQLYRWSQKHPPPAAPGGATESKGGARVTSVVVEKKEDLATVLTTIYSAPGRRPLEFRQRWQVREKEWFFLVPAR